MKLPLPSYPNDETRLRVIARVHFEGFCLQIQVPPMVVPSPETADWFRVPCLGSGWRVASASGKAFPLVLRGTNESTIKLYRTLGTMVPCTVPVPFAV